MVVVYSLHADLASWPSWSSDGRSRGLNVTDPQFNCLNITATQVHYSHMCRYMLATLNILIVKNCILKSLITFISWIWFGGLLDCLQCIIIIRLLITGNFHGLVGREHFAEKTFVECDLYTALVKFFPANVFCNTKVAGHDEILSSKNFHICSIADQKS